MKEYMKDVTVGDAIKAGRKDTICWDCAKAMRGGCCWADPDQQKPVKDWVAIKNSKGYVVHACPLFERETYACGTYRTADDYILALEIEVTRLRDSIARLKKVQAPLRRKIKKMENMIADLTWQNEVHMSE